MAALPGQPSGDAAVVRAVETVARALGNTRAVCRRCYVHPAVIDAYLDGSLARTLEGRVSRGCRAPARRDGSKPPCSRCSSDGCGAMPGAGRPGALAAA